MPADLAEFVTMIVAKLKSQLVPRVYTAAEYDATVKRNYPTVLKIFGPQLAALPWGGWVRKSELSKWRGTLVELRDGRQGIIEELDRGGFRARTNVGGMSIMVRGSDLTIKMSGTPFKKKSDPMARGSFLVFWDMNKVAIKGSPTKAWTPVSDAGKRVIKMFADRGFLWVPKLERYEQTAGGETWASAIALIEELTPGEKWTQPTAKTLAHVAKLSSSASSWGGPGGPGAGDPDPAVLAKLQAMTPEQRVAAARGKNLALGLAAFRVMSPVEQTSAIMGLTLEESAKYHQELTDSSVAALAELREEETERAARAAEEMKEWDQEWDQGKVIAVVGALPELEWREVNGAEQAPGPRDGMFRIVVEGRQKALYFADADAVAGAGGQSRFLASGSAAKLRRHAAELAARGQPTPRGPVSPAEDAALEARFMAGAEEDE